MIALHSPTRSRRGRCGSTRGGPGARTPDVELVSRAGALECAAAAECSRPWPGAPRDARVGSAQLSAAARLRGRAARPLRAPGAGSRARRSRAAPAAPHRRGVRRRPITWTKARSCAASHGRGRERWLELAQRLTARALARECARSMRGRSSGRLLDSDEDGVEDVPRETVWLSVTPRVRARWSRARLLARRVAGEALSQAAVAEVIAAEVMSAIGVDGDPGLTTPLHLSRAANVHSSVHGSARESRSPTRAQTGIRVQTVHSPLSCRLPRAARRGPRIRERRARRAAAARAADRAAVARRDRTAAARGRALASYRFHGCSNLAVFARERSACRRARRTRCCGSSGPAHSRPSCARRFERSPVVGAGARADSRARAGARRPWRAAWWRTPRRSRCADSRRTWIARS